MAVFWSYFFRPWILLSVGYLLYEIKKKRKIFDILYLFYMFALTLSLCLSGRYYGHYAQVIIPALAYPFSLIALWWEERALSKKTKYMVMTAVALICAALPISCAINRTFISIAKTGYPIYDVRLYPNLQQVLAEIQNRTNEDDTISVYGHANTIYVNSHRLPASRHSFPTAVINIRPGTYEEYLADLQNNRPKLIIIANYDSGKNKPNFLAALGYKECYKNSQYGIFECP